jgi:branched-chain amino acid transport system ATP-binding protein
MTCAVRARGLTFGYAPGADVLTGLDLTVGHGERVAVLGPNGAGKSTLMRAVMGLVATQGAVRFRGHAVPRNPVGAAAMGLVLVPEGRGIFGPMSVAENLELGAYLLNDKAELARRHERVLSLFPRLKERLSQTAGSPSGGEQQMLAVGRALMSEPKLLLLDEPSLGLAPTVVDIVFDALAAIRERGLGVLLVEQRAQRTVAASDRCHVLANGELRVTLGPENAEDTETMVAAYFA